MPRGKSQKSHEQPNPPERRSERLSARRSDPVATPPPAAPRGSLGAPPGRMTSPAAPEAAVRHPSTAVGSFASLLAGDGVRSTYSSTSQQQGAPAPTTAVSDATAAAALRAILAQLRPAAVMEVEVARSATPPAAQVGDVEPTSVADRTAVRAASTVRTKRQWWVPWLLCGMFTAE